MKKILLFMVFALFLVVLMGSASANVNDSLAGYWQLNGTGTNLINSVTSGNNGTILSSNTTQTADGVFIPAENNNNTAWGDFSVMFPVTSYNGDATYSIWWRSNWTNTHTSLNWYGFTATDLSHNYSFASGSSLCNIAYNTGDIYHNLAVTVTAESQYYVFRAYKDGNICDTMSISTIVSDTQTSVGTRVFGRAGVKTGGVDVIGFVGLQGNDPDYPYEENASYWIKSLGYWTRSLSQPEVRAIVDAGVNESYLFPDVNPVSVSNFNSSYVLGNDNLILDMNDYFSNYQNISISYSDPTYNQSIYLTAGFGGNTTSSENGSLNTYLTPSADDILLTFQNKNIAFNQQITVTAINSAGTLSKNFILIQQYNSTSTGLYEQIVNTFTGIFPASSDLSLVGKIGFVIVTMLIITAGCLVIVNPKHSHLGVYLALVLDAMLFIFFVVIGYIGVGILVFITLVALALAYLFLRGGIRT